MDEFIKENIENKAILLGFKKLKEKVNIEMVYHTRGFGNYSKGILIVGANYARLMLEVLERGLDRREEFDVSDLNFVNSNKSKLSLWNIPIYVTLEEDVVMIINSLGELYEDSLGVDFWTKAERGHGFHISAKEFKTLIEELPDSSKLRRVLPEEMV